MGPKISVRVPELPQDTVLPLRRRLFRRLYPAWAQTGFTRYIKKRRLDIIDHLLEGRLSTRKRILEVGCSFGKDVFQFLAGREGIDLYGVDVRDLGLRFPGFTFVQSDAEHLEFPDKFFDVTVTVGMMEHVQPLEKLCRVAAEIARVSRAYAICVPSISTPFEPHTLSFYWHLRSNRERRALLYLSDEAWRSMEAFRNASLYTFWYLPPLIRNLVIYGWDEQS